MCYPLFLLYKQLNMFRTTMCPSSGADDCVVLSPRVGIVPWLQEGCQNRLAGSVSSMDTAVCLLAHRQQYLFDICLLLYVQSWTADDGRKDRPKYVECRSK